MALDSLVEMIKAWWPAFGGGSVLGAKWLFRYKQGDIPACNTRIVRQGRGLPWNKLLAIHPLKDGRIELKALYPEEGKDLGEYDGKR